MHIIRAEAWCAYYSAFVHEEPVKVKLGDLSVVPAGTIGECLESKNAGGNCIYSCQTITVLNAAVSIRSGGDVRQVSISPATPDGSVSGPVS